MIPSLTFDHYHRGMDPVLGATAMLFDVDGVLTDEHARVDALLIRAIAALVGAGVGATFITGRSRRWLDEQLLPVLSAGGMVPGSPSWRFAAEMGALRLGRSTGFEWQVSAEHAVPTNLRTELKVLPEEHMLSDRIEWDASKEATATFESLHRPEVPGFAAAARAALVEIQPECEALASRYGCRAAMSTYALDVLAPHLSKRVGAEFALADMAELSALQRVIVFGDSAGDIRMAEVAREGTSGTVEFVWVGRGAPPASQGVIVRQMPELHAEGTSLFLRENFGLFK